MTNNLYYHTTEFRLTHPMFFPHVCGLATLRVGYRTTKFFLKKVNKLKKFLCTHTYRLFLDSKMRISKSKKYAVEQFLIQKEVISLLNLENGFYLYELDNNKEIQNKIMNMVPDIWQYFAHMNVTGLLYPEKCKRPWLSIVRGVLKNRYILKYKACRYASKNEGSVFTMKYFVVHHKMKTSVSSDSLLTCDNDNITTYSYDDSSDNSENKIMLKLKRRKSKISLQLKYKPKAKTIHPHTHPHTHPHPHPHPHPHTFGKTPNTSNTTTTTESSLMIFS